MKIGKVNASEDCANKNFPISLCLRVCLQNHCADHLLFMLPSNSRLFQFFYLPQKARIDKCRDGLFLRVKIKDWKMFFNFFFSIFRNSQCIIIINCRTQYTLHSQRINQHRMTQPKYKISGKIVFRLIAPEAYYHDIFRLNKWKTIRIRSLFDEQYYICLSGWLANVFHNNKKTSYHRNFTYYCYDIIITWYWKYFQSSLQLLFTTYCCWRLLAIRMAHVNVILFRKRSVF